MAEVLIRVMEPADYAAAADLWRRCVGVGLDPAETPEFVARFLERNPTLSAVAVAADGALVGAVLCGHDGRRGFLYHLAVDEPRRGQGIGSRLLGHCLDGLRGCGIAKCNIFLYADNDTGRAFWERKGFRHRHDLQVLQRPLP
jgi:ribosomal protein S18 acetylase RimI-like enzyme